ncbi:polysaccharide deacetylase family protein [Candidatus Pelagibacter sp.]|nr:polysaccharide deacetylase family protein [Candidatus Pelagibacter sp.]
MITKTIFSLAASIIKFIIFYFFFLNAYADTVNKKYEPKEKGILALMYHRFEENKYPSTNIKLDIFQKHLDIIRENNLYFLNPKNFELEFNKVSEEKKILLTIDDAFSSFYLNAWPVLKKNKIPFILFVSTESVGKNGYMSWNEIIEISKEDFVFIGNHSHSHEYLVKYEFEEFKKDIIKSINIFKENLGYNSKFFSYPFGEYSLEQKKYITKIFDYAFGQHSGVIDLNKDKYELPRFPINEKYGDLERFKFLIKLLPIQYKAIIPEEKFLLKANNPPKLIIEFFNDQPKINKINCFSNEGGDWKNSKINYKKDKIEIIFTEKFLPRRGRINCSMQDKDEWRWFGTQFTLN